MLRKQYINEEELRTYMRKVLKENLEETLDETDFYSKMPNEETNFYSELPYEAKKKNDGEKPSKSNKKSKAQRKRTSVLHYFKQRTKDGNLLHKLAPFAYALWPEKDDANARSEFTKCLWGRLNDDGYPYSFTDDEINSLESMISSSAPSTNS